MSIGVEIEPRFSSGGSEPWSRVLASHRSGRLHLRRVSGTDVEAVWAVDALCSPADAGDREALGEFRGPLLDVGCGPGRMVLAAAEASAAALGIDVSHEAVRVARAGGAAVLVRSVFDRLPLEGRWRTVLLMDGNIGIGGDPEFLVDRCRALLARGGLLVAETEAEPEVDARGEFTVLDDEGNESAPFPWARIGWRRLQHVAAVVGFASSAHVEAGGRHFVRARR